MNIYKILAVNEGNSVKIEMSINLLDLDNVIDEIELAREYFAIRANDCHENGDYINAKRFGNYVNDMQFIEEAIDLNDEYFLEEIDL